MAEVLPRHLFLGFIAFTFLILGGMSFVSQVRTSDATFADDSQMRQFNSTFDRYDELESSINGMRDSVSTASGDSNPLTFFASLLRGLWQAVKGWFTSMSFVFSTITGLSSFFGVPSWASGLAIMAVVVVLVFAIIGMIFQREA